MDVFDSLTDLLGGGSEGQRRSAGTGILDYLRDVVSGKVASEGVLAQNHYDPNRSFAQNALDPAAIEQATDVAFGVGPGAIRAYHGSPHSFDRFDLSKIGTGEGAQAYGRGLYFAEVEDLARGYRDALAGKVPLREYGGQPLETRKDWFSLIDKVEPQDWRLAQIIDAAGKQGSIRTALDTFEPHTRNAGDGPLWAAAIERFKEGVGPAAKGHMYEVDIHADPKAFLDWDKSLAGQSPEVLTALQQKLGQPAGLPPGYRLRQTGSGDYMVADDLGMGATGKGGVVARGRTPEEALRLYLPSGEETYQKLARDSAIREGIRGWDDQGASAALREAGIPGIRYLDQGSRGAGAGTSNYAIFDPSIIEILRKYGILPPVAAGAAGAGLLGGEEPY